MTAAVEITAGWVYRKPGTAPAERNATVRIGDGVAVSLGGASSLVLPAPANAHDHGRGLSALACGVADGPLEAWIPRTALVPPVDPYLQSLVAFGRLAKAGVAATQVAYDPIDLDRLPEEAKKVADAARAVGIQIALALPVLDQSLLGYADLDELARLMGPAALARLGTPRVPHIAEQIDAVEKAARVAEGNGVTVDFHAVGLTWCSPAMLEAIADRSAATGRRVFMHLLETRRQRTWCDRIFDRDPIGALDRFGLLSPRLGCAHGVHLREDEIELLAERGVILSVNTSSNLRLGSGIAPVGLFRKHGLRFGLGLDSFGFDDQPDWFTEMRLARLVHGGDGMRRVLGDTDLFASAMAGRTLAGGGDADWVVLDLDLLAADRIGDDPWQLFLVRAAGRHVTDLVVDGHVVVRDRTVVGIDLPAVERELLAAARAWTRTDGEVVAAHAAALERYFTDANADEMNG